MEELKYYHGEITGYARLQPPAGVGEMLASCHRLRRRRMAVAVLRSAGAGHRLPGRPCATAAVLQGRTFGTQSLYLLPIQAGTTS